MTEAEFQAQVIDVARYRGWMVMHQRPAQIKLLRALRYDGDPRALTKREASAMIDKLKTEHPF